MEGKAKCINLKKEDYNVYCRYLAAIPQKNMMKLKTKQNLWIYMKYEEINYKKYFIT